MNANTLTTRNIVRVVVIVVVSVIALYLIYRLRTPITWIVIGAFIAVALSAPVNASTSASSGAGPRSPSSTWA